MAAGIISYLDGCSEFFKSQGELLNKELMAESVDSMSASVQSQIQRLASLEPPDATLINAAIARSAFDNKHKQDFATAVMRRIAAPAGDVADDGKSGQVMTVPYTYCTQSDADYFRDHSKSFQQCAVRFRQRLKLVGLVKPTEKTYGALAATIAAVREPDLTRVALHALVLDLKSSLPIPTGNNFPVMRYPENPNDLPNRLFVAAYASEPPLTLDIGDIFKDIVGRCPVRTSHKALRSSPPAANRQSVVPHSQPVQHQSGLTLECVDNLLDSFAKKFGIGTDMRSHGAASGASSLPADGGTGRLVVTDPRVPVPGATPQHAAIPLPDIGEVDEPAPELKTGHAAAADDVVANMERLAMAPMKRPASAKPRPITPSKVTKIQRKPAAKPTRIKVERTKPRTPSKVTKSTKGKTAAKPTKIKVKGKWVSLGCGRCRGGRYGCSVCLNPNYGGTRFHKW